MYGDQDPKPAPPQGPATKLPSLVDDFYGGGQAPQQPQQPQQDMWATFEQSLPENSSTTRRAQGVGEHLAVGAGAFLKSLGDAMANSGTFSLKVLGGVAELNNPNSLGRYLGGDGPNPFSKGYEGIATGLEQQFGTRDPGVMDLMSGGQQMADPRFGVGPKLPTLSQAADQAIHERLGGWEALPNTMGFLTSFAIGPGAMVGGAATQISAPLARVASNAAGRVALKMTGASKQYADELISQGRAWEVLAKSPNFSPAVNAATSLMASRGKNIRDFMDMTAANVAQSYAMETDATRDHAATAAMMLSVPMFAANKVGNSVRNLLTGKMLSSQQKTVVADGLEQFNSGKIGLQELDKLIRKTAPMKSGLASVVSGALEGTSLTFMSQDARDTYQKWMAGDPEAGAALMGSLLGTGGMIAFLKHQVPLDILPHIKAARPDLNRLTTLIEADAARKAAMTPEAPPAATQPPAQPARPGRSNLLQGPDTRPVEQGATLTEAQRAELAQGLEQTLEGFQDPQPARQDPIQQGAGQPQQEGPRGYHPKDAYTQNVEQGMRDYAWADGPTLGVLHSGWEGTLEPAGVVGLKFGEDHSVRLRNGMDADRGVILEVPAATEKALNDFGVKTIDIPNRTSNPGALGDQATVGSVTYTNEGARLVLDQVAMLSSARRLQSDLTFQRMNLREIENGIWIDDISGKVYKSQLDGSAAVAKDIYSPFDGRTEIEAIGGFEKPVFDNQQTQLLEQWLLRKQALAPDPITDTLLAQVISAARNGKSNASDDLRDFLSSVPPEVLAEKLRPGEDRHLAHDLAALAMGTDNAAHTTMAWQQGQSTSEPGNTGPMSDRLAGKPPREPAAQEAVPPMERQAKDTSPKVIAPERPFVGGEHVESAREPSQPTATWTAGSDYAAGGKVPERNVLPEAVRQERRAQEREMRRENETIAERRTRRYGAMAAVPISDPSGTLAMVAGGALAVYGAYKGYKAIRKWYAKPGNAAKVKRYSTRVLDEASRLFEGMSLPGKTAFSDRVKRQNQRFAEIRGQAGEAAKDIDAAYKAIPREDRTEMVPINPQRPQDGTVPATVLAADGKINKAHWGQFHAAMQKVLKVLYGATGKAGGFRQERNSKGEMEWVPIDPNRTGNVIARQPGRDFGVGMADPVIRRKWADSIVNNSKPRNVIDPVTKQSRPMTGADLDARWQQEFADLIEGKVKVNEAEGDSAVLHMREFDTVPYELDGLELLNPDTRAVLKTQIVRQAGNAAEIEMHGQNIPTEARKVMLKQGGLSPEHTDALTNRFGVDDALASWMKSDMATTGDQTIDKGMVDLYRATLKDLGGGNSQPAGPIARAWQRMESVLRAAKTATTFAFDIPEVIFRPLGENAGLRSLVHGARTLFNGNLREAARMRGSVEQDMLNGVIGETKGPLKTLADAYSFLSNFSERAKTYVFDGVGSDLVAQWKAGRRVNSDVDLLGEMGYSPADTTMLLGGTAPQTLTNHFIRSFAQKLASRRASHERPYALKSPTLNAWVRFIQWPMNRMTDFAQTSARVIRKGATPAERATAARRLLFKLGGAAVSGAIGQFFSYILVDALKAENGAARWMRELSDYTSWTVGKALSGAIVGGPIAQLWGAAMKPEEGFSWSNLLSPFSVLYSASSIAHRLIDGDVLGAMRESTSGIGLAPRPVYDLFATASAAYAGTMEPTSDNRMVRGFMRLEGITIPYSERTKDPEFYAAIKDAVRTVEAASDEDRPNATKVAMEKIRTALSLAPEESVAAKIESYMHFHMLNKEQVTKFIEHVGDEKRVSRMAQHDEILRTFAQAVRLKEGVNPTPWEKDLAMSSVEAAHGISKHWRGLAERAVEETALRLEGGEGYGSQIDEVAQAMSLYPAQLKGLFSEKVERAILSGNMDRQTLVRRISANLRDRVKSNRAKLRDRARKEKRNG